MSSPSADLLERRLAAERVVEFDRAAWTPVLSGLEVVERHATGVAGDLVIARCGALLVALEFPYEDVAVARRLADADEGARLVAKRLHSYERMWDG